MLDQSDLPLITACIALEKEVWFVGKKDFFIIIDARGVGIGQNSKELIKQKLIERRLLGKAA